MSPSRMFLLGLLLSALGAERLHAQTTSPQLRAEALRTMKLAATYYRGNVASHGGYVYYYSTDLTQRWGEGRAGKETIFVQPPGTPTVGIAFLRAYEATGDKFYLDAAREAAEALVAGQLVSGGWTQVIHFAPPERGRMGKYRLGRGGNWDTSSLDDGQTQAALAFLIRADRALGFADKEIHEAALFGLDALLKAQFPCGAFPQVWRGPVESKPVARARFPDYDWRTQGRVKNYWDYYTLNDGLAGTVSDTLIAAHKVYGDDKYLTALAKLGDFLLLAQMPDPQPGWCQQYNYEMAPIWARKFEPPAVTGWESQDVMRTLIKISRHTGDKKYLEPIPKALAYLKKCLLSDGRIARYYELRTNRPLYMDANYQLTYDDSKVPDHYGWKQQASFDLIEQDLQAAQQGAQQGAAPPQPRAASNLESDVKRIIEDLDDQGRWVSTYADERLVGQPSFPQGFRYVSSEVFSRNLAALSEYVARVGK